MRDVSKIVKRHLNEVSADLVNRAIASGEDRLKNFKYSNSPKEKRGIKQQIQTFKKYKNDNFPEQDDFKMLKDAVNKFYENLDSDIVKNCFVDDEYEDLAETQNYINWNMIKKKMHKLYNKILNKYNFDNAICSPLELIFLTYFAGNWGESIYNYSWSEEDYPDNQFRDYGEMVEDMEYTHFREIESLCKELPEQLLSFIGSYLMGFFYDEDLYN